MASSQGTAASSPSPVEEPPPPTPFAVAVAEQASDNESFHSGDEDFDASLEEGKGAALAPADGELPPEKAGAVAARGDGDVGKVIAEGPSGGDEKGGVLGGSGRGGGSETLVSEGRVVGGGAGSEKVGLGGEGDAQGGDLGSSEAERSVLGVGSGGAGGKENVVKEGGAVGGDAGSEKVGLVGDGDAKVGDLGPLEAGRSVLCGGAGRDSGLKTLVSEGGEVGSEKVGLEGDGDSKGSDLGHSEAKANPINPSTSDKVDGAVVEKENEVTAPEAVGGGDVAKGTSEKEGVSGGGEVGDGSRSSHLGGVEKDEALPVESAGVVSEHSKGPVASGFGGESHNEIVGDSGAEKVEPLVEPKQGPLGAVAAGGGESLEKEVEQSGPTTEGSKATAVVQGASETGGRDIAAAVGTTKQDEGMLKAEVEVCTGATKDSGYADTGAEQGDVNEVSPEVQDGELEKISAEFGKGTVDLVSDSHQVDNIDGNVEDGEDDGLEAPDSRDSNKVASLGSSEAVRQLLKDLEEVGSAASSGVGSSQNFSQEIDGQIATDSDEEAETDEEGGGGREIFDADALAALLRAATGASSDGNVTISASDAPRVFSIDRPAGLGSSVPSLRPGPARTARLAPHTSSDLTVTGEPESNMDEEERALHEKVDQVRVKFLRLVHRLGHSAEDTVAAQVLYRLGLAEGIKRGRQTGRAFSIESAKRKALRLEESGEQPLEFSCNILVLGKSGVGKSSIINSILGEQLAQTNPFQPSTTGVKEIAGVVDGVNIRFLDTPGLRPSIMDQGFNKKILLSIKKHTKKCPPDIVLYVDRLDTQTRDFNDLPLLRSIASVLGSSIWFNAIVALTHAASAPPDGPNGTPLGYEVFVAQRSHVVQHSIRQAAGDMRLMNPVALVENHPSCRRNREGQRVLPNGMAWRPQLLLLCYSSKILSEANSLLKIQDPSPGKLFGFRMRSPPLPYLLSSLLQSRAYPKLPADEGGDSVDSDVDLEELSDSDQEEEDEYDKLPPFKPLKKAELAQLTKEQRKQYFDEYEYRVKLLQKKQWREELKRLREMKKRGKAGLYDADRYDDYDQDATPAAVPVPLPDMVLPPTFDCDNPTYRYRFLEPVSRLLARPVLDTHGWDHDCGYDGVSLEQNLAILGQFPASFALQITKDKKEFNVHLDSSGAVKLGENGSGLAGFDIQSVGRQLAYILRSEAKFKNLKKNKTAAGVSVTFLGENVITGLKVEDQVVVKKTLCLVGSSGAVRSKGDVAYGANLEARLRPKDYPLEPEIGTLGISLMKWRRDLALGGNAQTQVSIGRNSKMTFRLGLNNKLTGQFSIRTSTSDQLQISLLGVIPVALYIYHNIWPSEVAY